MDCYRKIDVERTRPMESPLYNMELTDSEIEDAKAVIRGTEEEEDDEFDIVRDDFDIDDIPADEDFEPDFDDGSDDFDDEDPTDEDFEASLKDFEE
ncbi:MAG: hypothetical protein IJ953_08430 [Campylobacter sp.]|nr:hypothetical protein [Campylobacter sp.]